MSAVFSPRVHGHLSQQPQETNTLHNEAPQNSVLKTMWSDIRETAEKATFVSQQKHRKIKPAEIIRTKIFRALGHSSRYIATKQTQNQDKDN